MNRAKVVKASTAAGVLALTAAAVAVAGYASPGQLTAAGPTSVSGTPATAVYPIADDPVREIRYVDRDELRYSFTLHNAAPLPVTVTGAAAAGHEATMLRVAGLEDEDGGGSFTLAPGADRDVTLVVFMTECERVSSRAASMIGDIQLETLGFGFLPRTVIVSLPERIRTQSPRDASCPRSTTATRSGA